MEIKSHAKIIENSLKKTWDKDFQGNHWGQQHYKAWYDRNADSYPKSPIVGIIWSLATYADNHRKMYESNIGDDGVLGPAWADSVQNVRTMLNGELGNLDGGTLDSLLCDMLAFEGFKVD